MFRIGERRKNDDFLQIDNHGFPQFFQQTLQHRLLALISEERQSKFLSCRSDRSSGILSLPLIEIIQERFGHDHRFGSFLLSTVCSTAELIAFDLL